MISKVHCHRLELLVKCFLVSVMGFFSETQNPLLHAPRDESVTVLKDNALSKNNLRAGSDGDNESTGGVNTLMQQSKHTWMPGIYQRLPWTSTAALLTVLICAGACIAVLKLSYLQEVERWPIRPSIWLAIISAVANANLRFVHSEGLNIAFWHQASIAGSLRDLHHYWIYGTSLQAAITSFRRFNLVALASVIVAAVVIDGPLLQRSSSIRLLERSERVSVNMTVATEVPFGYTGMYFTSEKWLKQSIPTSWFLQTLLAYNQRERIPASSVLGCPGTCIGEIEAAGLFKNCTERLENFSWRDEWMSYDISSRRVFGIDWEFLTQDSPRYFLDYEGYVSTSILEGKDDPIPEDEPYISLSVVYSPLPVILGSDNQLIDSHTLVNKTCRLYSATNRYRVRIQNNTATTNASSPAAFITIDGVTAIKNGSIQNVSRSVAQTGVSLNFRPEDPNKDDLLNDYNGTLALSLPVSYFNDGCHESQSPLYTTLGGLQTFARDFLSGNVSARYLRLQGVHVEMSGTLTNQLMRSNKTYRPDNMLDSFQYGIGWDDPTPFIFSTLDELMFRIAIDAAHSDLLQRVKWQYYDFARGGIRQAPNKTTSAKYQVYPQPQIIEMEQTRTLQVYDYNLTFLAAALAVMFLAVIVIIPMFNGFWQLGRDTSLSPLELANAFGSPILDDANSNMSANQIVEASGNRSVRYGHVPGFHRGRLQFDKADAVVRPFPGYEYE